MTTFFSALSTGAIYTLLALGFNVVFVSAGMFNFAPAALLEIPPEHPEMRDAPKVQF